MLRASVLRLTAAICAVLGLASVADGQTGSLFGPDTSGARAERLAYGVDAGFGQTDNVSLAPNNKVAQTIATVDVDFAVKHQSRRLDVGAKGNFSDFAYLQGAYGNQLIGRFDGLADVALIPQRLTWVVQDDFGQAALDPYVPTTPGNLESINYFSTGPDLALRVGRTGFFDTGLRYARAQYQTSPFSSNRVLGSLAAGLNLSARSSVSLNAAAERVQFDNTTVNGNFDRTSGYVRYEIQGARTALSMDLGVTKISQNASSGTSVVVLGKNGRPTTLPVTIPQSAYSATGPLARIAASRKLSSAATLTVSGGRELTDASSSFSGIQGGAIGIAGTASAALTSSGYTTNFASVGWQYERNRTTIGVSGRWEKDVYRTQPQFDLTRSIAEFNVSRKLTRALALQVFGRYNKGNYVHGNLLALVGSPKYDDTLVAGALTWRYSRMVEFRLRAEHSSRTTPSADFGYRENRVFLTIGYRPETKTSNDSQPELLRSNDNPGA